MNKRKTIEELCITKNSLDLWDEFNKDINVSNLILHSMPPDSIYNFRLLGPFICAKRIYTGGLSKILDKINIKEIIDGNQEAYKEAIRVVDDYFGKDEIKNKNGTNETKNRRTSNFENIDGLIRYNGSEGFFGYRNGRENDINYEIGASKTSKSEAITQLSNLINPKKYWQKCILINALYGDGASKRSNSRYINHKIFAMPSLICNELAKTTYPSPKAAILHPNIIGLHCYDIQISKKGKGINTQYNVQLLPESTLSELEMNRIIEDGLYDIPNVIKTANKKRYPYIYKIEPNYIMPKEFMGCILEEYKKFEEKNHLEQAEEKINEIPREAFEELNNMNNGIGSLEVE